MQMTRQERQKDGTDFMTKYYNAVPIKVTVAVVKYHDQKQLREQRFIVLTSILLFVIKASQGRNSKQIRNLEARADQIP